MTLTNRTISKISFLNNNNVVTNWYENLEVGVIKEYLPGKKLPDLQSESSSYLLYELVESDESDVTYLVCKLNTIDYNIIEWVGENDPVNDPQIGFTYDVSRNAFLPPSPDETYILNESTLEWEPDPEKLYDLHGDGKLYRYDSKNLCWWPTW